jgi:membrane protease YdiL (CAAX protease family)
VNQAGKKPQQRYRVKPTVSAAPSVSAAGKTAKPRERYQYTGEVYDPPGGVGYIRVFTGVGRRPATLFGGLVAVLFCFAFIYPMVLRVGLTITYMVRGRTGEINDYILAASGFEYIEGLLFANLGLALLIPVVFLLVRYLHQREPVYVSSVQPGLRWRYLLMVLVIALVVFNVFYWSMTGRSVEWSPTLGYGWWLVVALITGPLQAAGEEYLFRGYLMQVLGSYIPQKWIVVAGSALVFAVTHGTQNLAMFADRAAFGALMGALVVLTGGVEASIAIHAANNLMVFTTGIMSGGLAAARADSVSTWSGSLINIAVYALIGLAAWGLGRKLRLATKTPE